MTKKVSISVPQSSASLLESNNLTTADFYKMTERAHRFFEIMMREKGVDASIQWEVMAFMLGFKARHQLDIQVFSWVTDEWRKAINDARHQARADGIIKDD